MKVRFTRPRISVEFVAYARIRGAYRTYRTFDPLPRRSALALAISFWRHGSREFSPWFSRTHKDTFGCDPAVYKARSLLLPSFRVPDDWDRYSSSAILYRVTREMASGL